MTLSLQHPLQQKLSLAANPIRYSRTPLVMEVAPPTLGQHVDTVLAELGYSEEDVSTLKEQGVI